MTAPRAPGDAGVRWRLAVIGLLGIGVAAAVYVAGRLHQPDYSFSLFGTDPVPPKSLLATIVLGLAALQVLLALWMYRKLPLAGRGADGAGRAAGKTGRVQAGDRVVAVPEGMRGIGPPRADHLADVVVRE